MRLASVAAALVWAAAVAFPAAAQDGAVTNYRQPPDIIREILDTPPTPAVMVAPDGRTLVLLGRPGMPPIAELAEPELRLAGLRINPRTNGPSRTGHIDALTFQDIATGERREVELPPGARVAYPQWSPDGTRLAFANTVDDGIELWVADVQSRAARRLLGPVLNAAIGSPYTWLPGGAALLVRRVAADRGDAPVAPGVPAGPIVRQHDGAGVPARTFPDLLSSAHDERLFDYYFTAELVRQPIAGAAPERVGDAGLISAFSAAPDGRHVLVTRVTRPYSYSLNVWAFGSRTDVIDMSGAHVRTVDERTSLGPPLSGRDVVPAGRRNIQWRADAPATLVWVEAADSGDAAGDAAVRDRVLMLDAPFTGTTRTLIDLPGRYAGIQWARPDLALVHSRWATTARATVHVVDPSRPDAAPRLLEDRSTTDRYGDPGVPVLTTNTAGYDVLRLTPDGLAFYRTGQGASERGTYPFLDRVSLSDGSAERLWQAEDPYYEYVIEVLDDEARSFITRRESSVDAPNYVLYDRVTGPVRALTHFTDPAPQIAGLQRQVITYEREDGVALSAVLFTPPGYDAARDGPLPLLMWAYPRQYRDAAAASQVSRSDNRFSRPSGLSHLFLVTQGYAVLDGPSMPIVGREGVEPNDTYVEQLVSSARAAVDEVVGLGVADRDRIAVGGHSYGAFMTVNLLAHSDLFRAGIALSGAYNRTLTPFGFQMERRSYWDARSVYDRMSPFAYADRIDAPLLLIHGAADSNPGTFPMQSERLYQALAGLGATVRFVSLPHESHTYVARESVLHVLAEMVDWLDAWVKPDVTPGG